MLPGRWQGFFPACTRPFLGFLLVLCCLGVLCGTEDRGKHKRIKNGSSEVVVLKYADKLSNTTPHQMQNPIPLTLDVGCP